MQIFAEKSGEYRKKLMESTMKIAKRLNQIEPFHVMDLLGKAKAMQNKGRDVIHLEVGEPDFATPKAVVQAGIQALEQGQTHYTAATGLPELKQAISDFYLERYSEEVAPERIVITPGASGALQLLVSLLTNPGENVLLTDPGYPCNRHFLANVNADGVLVPTKAEDGFHLTAQQVGEYWQENTVGALVATPSNPTGSVMSHEQLSALHQAVRDKQGVLLVDEIYHGLTFDNKKPHSAVNYGDDVFVINSFSKYFAMTGWRLGWLVAPKWAVPSLDKLAQNLFLAPSTPAQYAALASFQPDVILELEARKATFAERLQYLLPQLEQLGFIIPAQPGGAFYIYADISGLDHRHNQNSMQFCLDLLEQTGVAITPGIDFGRQQGHHFVRFAYTSDIPVLEQAIARLRDFIQNATSQ
ncbi:MAG: aspartate/methionine/tyrosine aminotransferase [Oceanicoccus sp.]|jgi:aspartate/methionine/tyrosine aminotransferase